MKTIIIKWIAVLVLVILGILTYHSDIISVWRYYNNGVRAFNDRNYKMAAQEFEKAINVRNDPTLKYNQVISAWTQLKQSGTAFVLTGTSDTSKISPDQSVVDKMMALEKTAQDLLAEKQLPIKYQALLCYSLGEIQLQKPDTSAAVASLGMAVDQRPDFNLALKKLAQINSRLNSTVEQKLLLNNTATEKIDIIQNWKPF